RHSFIHHVFFSSFYAVLILLAGAVFTTRAVAQTGPATAPADNTPSYAALADLLENDKARDKLIEQLRSLAPEGVQAPAAGVAPPTRAEPSRDPAGLPLSQRLAIDLQTFTASLLHDTAATMTAVRAALSGEPVPGNHLRASLPALSVLLFTIVGTLLAYAAFRVLAGFGFARLNAWILDD